MIRPFPTMIMLCAVLVAGCVSPPQHGRGKTRSTPIVQAFEDRKQAYDRHDFARAAPRFEAFLAAHADTPLAEPALYYLASCQKELGNLAEAVALYEKVLKKYPSGIWHDVARYDLHYMRKHMGRN